MKRKFTIGFLISLILLSGCNMTNNKNIKISKWMFSDDLTPYKCENLLGKSDVMNNFKQYVWNNYELIDGYSGVLALDDNKNQDYLSSNENRKMYCFHWTIECNENDYNDIINNLKKYKELKEYIADSDNPNYNESWDKDGIKISFVTNYEDINYNPEFLNSNEKGYFSIASNYKDDVLELQWRLNRRAIYE